ncbi:hypothetical protein SADUNF_Sadunf06G0024600 [Salix dunnii]|uniref:Uncharacterized protein n=1 Tax=Salix dunnii TaxID=1413687 RepID=A0A835JXB1_9ROSI|nr:hypothetical protein SADUNF_Sadunf06G0024600 [Salix dunnii]
MTTPRWAIFFFFKRHIKLDLLLFQSLLNWFLDIVKALEQQNFQLLHQTQVTTILGSACDGDKAKKSRRVIIRTGIKRKNKGGGDNGGNTSGSTSKDTVNTAMVTIDLKLNSLTINFYAKA